MSPPDIAKETYIQKIQELAPEEKLSDSVCKLLKNNRHFYNRLHQCTMWNRKDAKEFIQEAKLFLKTSTKLQVAETDSYRFGEVQSWMGSGGTLIQKVYDEKGQYCAKIGRLFTIQAEFEVGQKVVGPCVMPIIKFIILPHDKATIITPLYAETVASWVLKLESFPKEDSIVPVLLCGISAIYSFASQGLAHCDIKLTNLMFESITKIVLIDFGSAKPFGDFISSTTPGIRFEHCSPSIRYDINSLAIAIARIMIKKPEDFISKDHLLSVVAPFASNYPVIYEILGMLRIDEDFNSAAELLQVWRKIYAFAREKKPFVSDFSHFAPPSIE